jgi:hypothetical protein
MTLLTAPTPADASSTATRAKEAGKGSDERDGKCARGKRGHAALTTAITAVPVAEQGWQRWWWEARFQRLRRLAIQRALASQQARVASSSKFLASLKLPLSAQTEASLVPPTVKERQTCCCRRHRVRHWGAGVFPVLWRVLAWVPWCLLAGGLAPSCLDLLPSVGAYGALLLVVRLAAPRNLRTLLLLSLLFLYYLYAQLRNITSHPYAADELGRYALPLERLGDVAAAMLILVRP